jgi:hypothetical protein
MLGMRRFYRLLCKCTVTSGKLCTTLTGSSWPRSTLHGPLNLKTRNRTSIHSENLLVWPYSVLPYSFLHRNALPNLFQQALVSLGSASTSNEGYGNPIQLILLSLLLLLLLLLSLFSFIQSILSSTPFSTWIPTNGFYFPYRIRHTFGKQCPI